LSLGFGIGFAAVTWIVIYLIQKRWLPLVL
jgi:hypothetical protein